MPSSHLYAVSLLRLPSELLLQILREPGSNDAEQQPGNFGTLAVCRALYPLACRSVYGDLTLSPKTLPGYTSAIANSSSLDAVHHLSKALLLRRLYLRDFREPATPQHQIDFGRVLRMCSRLSVLVADAHSGFWRYTLPTPLHLPVLALTILELSASKVFGDYFAPLQLLHHTPSLRILVFSFLDDDPPTHVDMSAWHMQQAFELPNLTDVDFSFDGPALRNALSLQFCKLFEYAPIQRCRLANYRDPITVLTLVTYWGQTLTELHTSVPLADTRSIGTVSLGEILHAAPLIEQLHIVSASPWHHFEDISPDWSAWLWTAQQASVRDLYIVMFSGCSSFNIRYLLQMLRNDAWLPSLDYLSYSNVLDPKIPFDTSPEWLRLTSTDGDDHDRGAKLLIDPIDDDSCNDNVSLDGFHAELEDACEERGIVLDMDETVES